MVFSLDILPYIVLLTVSRLVFGWWRGSVKPKSNAHEKGVHAIRVNGTATSDTGKGGATRCVNVGVHHTSHESAAACWARRDGRFKACGARPDIFASERPPSYSLVNLDLPLPSLSSKEAAGVAAFAARVIDVAATGKRTDSATLLRFLRARKGDVNAAEAYFRKALSYRDELQLDDLDTCMNLEAYEHCFAPWWCRGGIIGHGKNGAIVGFERTGRCRLPEVLKAMPFKVLRKLDAVHSVRILAAFEEDSLRSGVPFVENNILVMDCAGMDWSWCRLDVARMWGKLIEGRDKLIPNTLRNILLINAPGPASAGWSLYQHFLDPATREKVQIVSGRAESLQLLRRYMSDDIIPAYLGGKLHTQGDPECRLLLGTDAPVPPEALERLFALIDGRSPMNADGAKSLSEPEEGVWHALTACCGSGR